MSTCHLETKSVHAHAHRPAQLRRDRPLDRHSRSLWICPALQDGPRFATICRQWEFFAAFESSPRGISDAALSCHGDVVWMCDQGTSCLGWFGIHGNTRARRFLSRLDGHTTRGRSPPVSQISERFHLFFHEHRRGAAAPAADESGKADAMIVGLSWPSPPISGRLSQ